MIRETLKESIGLKVGLYNFRDFYFEGVIIAVDSENLKMNDRKDGVKIILLSDIKTVVSIK